MPAIIQIYDQPAQSGGLVASASQSPIWWIFQALSTGSPGTSAQLVITITGAVPAGDWVSVDTLTLTATASLNPGVNEFTPGATPADTAAIIALKMKASLELKDKFFIYWTSNLIVVRPNSAGVGGDFDHSVSSGVITETYTAAVADNVGQTYTNFSVWAEVMIYRNGYFGGPVAVIIPDELIPIQTLQIQANNRYAFDFSETMRLLVSTPPPQVGLFTPQQLIGPAVAYRVRYGFSTGVPAMRQYVGDSDVCWAFRSALPLNDPSVDFGEYHNPLIVPIHPLDNHGGFKKPVRSGTPEYLCWPQRWMDDGAGGTATVAVCISATYLDGTTENEFVSITQVVNTPGQIMAVDVNPSAWGMAALEASSAKLVREYRVRIRIVTGTSPSFTMGIPITERRTYWVNRICPVDSFVVLFLNPLGGWDICDLDGYQIHQHDAERRSISRPLIAINPPASTITRPVVGVDPTDTYVLRSGWVGEATMLWLTDLIDSSQVYQVRPASGANSLLSLSIISSNWETNHADRLYSLTVTVRPQIEKNPLV